MCNPCIDVYIYMCMYIYIYVYIGGNTWNPQLQKNHGPSRKQAPQKAIVWHTVGVRKLPVLLFGGLFELCDTIAMFGIWKRTIANYRGPLGKVLESTPNLVLSSTRWDVGRVLDIKAQSMGAG